MWEHQLQQWSRNCRVALSEKGGRKVEDAQDPGVSLLQPPSHPQTINILSLKPQATNSSHTKPAPYVLTESSHFSHQMGLFQKRIQRFAVAFSLTEVPLVNCLKISSTWLQFISLTNPWGHDSTKQIQLKSSLCQLRKVMTQNHITQSTDPEQANLPIWMY